MRIAKAKTSAAFAVEWRNRHIAHRDLDLLLSSKTKMLEAATSRKVEQALSNLREVLDEIELFYCDTHTAYGFAPPWGADDLIYVLRDGLLRSKDRHAKWNRGERHDDDINPPEDI